MLGLASAGMLACGSGAPARHATPAATRTELQQYLRQVEPIRLAVNRLLEGADPILEAFTSRRISPALAGRRMEALERSFARYATGVAAVHPRTAALASLHAPYADTYVLEDAYLSALASGLVEARLEHLPDTEARQRAAIIRWRIGLEVLAARANVALPSDLQRAGRGEIAPRPRG